MRCSITIFVLLAGLVWSLALPAAAAGDLTSASYTLHTPTLGGGGGIDLVGGQGNVFAVGTTLGQSSPLGTSVGATTGTTLRGGFWPTLVGAVALDSDGDGQPDAADNCPFEPNPLQEDAGGLGVGSAPDGVGDACQCGDVTGDGFVTSADSAVILRAQLVPPTATMAQPWLCDVGGSASCSSADSVIVLRAQLVPPTATVQQQCASANP